MKKITTLFGAILTTSFILTSCGGENKNSQPKSNDSTSNAVNSDSTAKEELSQKKSTLINLIGDHKLSSISGFTGANTMVDYSIDNGKWIASGSSNSGGMREGYDIELSKEDLKKLQSMKIVVSEDLSLSLLCNNKEYFKTPFQEDGLSFFLKKSPKDYESNMSINLKPNSTFIDDYLYLYAKDNVKESEINYVDIVQVAADAIVLKYNTKTNEFEMSLFYGDCCDNSSYTFKKTSP
ncbi:MAG: hypothetical protein WD135_04105 [Ferruginibacter sp.]